jgi:hypothetical protein
MTNETTLNTVLENVERDLTPSPDPNVAKFAPAKYRGLPGNGELEHIQSNMRKIATDWLEEVRKLQTLHDNMKIGIETLQRSIG